MNPRRYHILLLCLFACFWVSGCALAQSGTKPKSRYDYLLYLPKDYDKRTVPYPVIIYLHGSSHRGNDLDRLKGYGLPQLIDQGRDFEFIIASPQCPDGKNWGSENWFDALYAELAEKYRIDPERVYLTGISLGGQGTFLNGMAHADKLAALVPLCGWLGNNDLNRLCTTLKTMPVWTFHGTADNVIHVSETERIVKSMKDCNANIKYTPLENEGHGIQFLYERDEIYQWMLQWKRKK